MFVKKPNQDSVVWFLIAIGIIVWKEKSCAVY